MQLLHSVLAFGVDYRQKTGCSTKRVCSTNPTRRCIKTRFASVQNIKPVVWHGKLHDSKIAQISGPLVGAADAHVSSFYRDDGESDVGKENPPKRRVELVELPEFESFLRAHVRPIEPRTIAGRIC